jgi:3-oxoacyl-[acyl-carrier-protein] synthase-3
MSFKITGTGASVPENEYDNKFFEGLVETSDEWITTRTGIKKRHILGNNETLFDISVKAAKNALSDANAQAEELDLIICSTLQGDYIVPSLACMLQKQLGAKCPSFDINAACSGFIYALDIADGYFIAGKARKILIVSCDRISKFIDYTDRKTCVLFGDGAGAAVLECGDSLKYIKLTAKGSDLINAKSCLPKSPFNEEAKQQGYLFMDGQEVFRFAVNAAVKAADEAEKTAGIKADDIKYYLLHQANGRIIEMVQSTLKQPPEKFPCNYDRYGNTSAASIPLLLDEISKKGCLKKGDTLFLSAFGGGLTSGACVIVWDKE